VKLLILFLNYINFDLRSIYTAVR